MAVLVANAGELGGRMIQLILGSVLRDEHREILISTLRTWIEEGGSSTRTGSRLYCHRNTVRNRLQRIEVLTGRSMADPGAVAELCVAVKALELYPPPPIGGPRGADRPW